MTGQRYSSYRNVAAAWVKRVPGHWAFVALKRSFTIAGGSTPKSDVASFWDGDILWATPADLSDLASLTVSDTTRKITAAGLASCGTTLIPAESIVVSTRAPIGLVAIAATQMCTNQGCRSLIPQVPLNPRYFAYLLTSCAAELNAHGTGSTFRELSGADLAAFATPVPPVEEQVAIAAFLDVETAKIDALVAEQRRLIELLQEKRAAVVTHAVTKGLNASVPLKPSGIEWFGDVPEHWQMTRLGRVCQKVADGPHFSPEYEDSGVPFLSARNVKVDGWSLGDVKYVAESLCDEFDKRIVPLIGDVLYTKGGTTGVARVVDLPYRFQVWVHIAVLKVRRDVIDPYFLAFALNSTGCYEQSQLLTRGATNNDLGLTRMVRIWFALPPIDEQRQIVGFLNRRVSMLDELRAQAERAIELLHERRKSMISAAVTGQVDVRGISSAEVA